MSNWKKFKKKLGDLADKTAGKTRELTDTAALKIKIANKEADRDLEYRKLGKLAYAKLKNLEGINAEALTEKISESLDNLDRTLSELEELKKEYEKKKAEKEAEKEARKAEKNESSKEEADDEDKLNLKVMDEFNEARKTADEAYEDAKLAAERAKKE